MTKKKGGGKQGQEDDEVQRKNQLKYTAAMKLCMGKDNHQHIIGTNGDGALNRHVKVCELCVSTNVCEQSSVLCNQRVKERAR